MCVCMEVEVAARGTARAISCILASSAAISSAELCASSPITSAIIYVSHTTQPHTNIVRDHERGQE